VPNHSFYGRHFRACTVGSSRITLALDRQF